MAILTLLMIFASAYPMLGIGRAPSGDLPPLGNLSADELASAKELWTGEVVIWQEEGKQFKAVAIFRSYDEGYFNRDAFHPGLIKKGLELKRKEDNTGPRGHEWKAVFLVPDELGLAPLYKNIFVDSSGNVFYNTNTWPKERCSSILVLGRRMRSMKKLGHEEAILFKPHLYGRRAITSSTGYAGIPCPSF